MRFLSEEKNIKDAFDEALCHPNEYPYALLYKISEVRLQETAELTGDDMTECMEARFFGTEGEIHIWKDDVPKAVKITDDVSVKGDVIERCYDLRRPFDRLGKHLIVLQYIGRQNDGQAFVELTRLKGIE